MKIKPLLSLLVLTPLILFGLDRLAQAQAELPRPASLPSQAALAGSTSDQNLYLPAMKKVNASFPDLDIVIQGQDGWFYYTGDSSMRDYQGLEQYSQETLATIDDCLSDLKRKMNQRGITLLFAVAPDKQSIYPEYLPPDIVKGESPTRLDQVLKYNQFHAQAPLFDLRPEMLLRKQEAVIYYRTDSHWNDLGAYYAYAQIMSYLTPGFPALAPRRLDEYTLTRRESGGLGLAEILGMQQAVTDEVVEFTPQFELRSKPADVPVPPINYRELYARKIDDPTLPTAVVYRDSFGTALLPFLEEHFQRVVFVLPAWIDYTFIDAEKPDIVIIELVERRITAGGSPCRLP